MKKICLILFALLFLASVEARRGGRGGGARGGGAGRGSLCRGDTSHNCPAETTWDAERCRCVCNDEPSTACAEGETWNTFSCGCSSCDLECPG